MSDAMQIELRGYEVARLTDGRWVVASNWRPTEQGLREALISTAWLNSRHPGETYTVRPVISMLPPQPRVEEAQPTDEEVAANHQAALEEARVAAGAFDVSDVTPKESE